MTLVSPTVRFSFDEMDWKPQKSSLKKPGMKVSVFNFNIHFRSLKELFGTDFYGLFVHACFFCNSVLMMLSSLVMILF